MSSASRARANYERYLKYNASTDFKIQDKPSVWVKDAELGFKKGEVQSEAGGKLKIKFGDGSSAEIAKTETEPANPGRFDGVVDCSDLSHLNNATVLHNLRVRYAEDLIHTYSGLFLVVVNPYKWIPIYTDEIIQIYQGKRRNEVLPHVYAVADEAYRAMVNGKRNQSILITGESGAGKTENTKKVIQYLATIAGKASQGGKLEEQILQANPMLEAFGNAKTNKNDNSSRFGKFIRIQFNAGGIICGTTIQVYLLEKSRVVHQGKGERTFHIFYQLLAGADSTQRKTYMLGKATDYGFFADQNAIVLKSMDDGAEWAHTLKAMEVIGLSSEEQDSIFRMVAGIMQCGNIKYASSYGGEGAKIENPDVIEKICNLWSIDNEVFSKSLIRPRVQAGREIVEKHLTKEEASYAREALCKSLYERGFLWIVKKLNRVLASASEANFIGVLDIAGFEIFENNSFEQLCINYTNEKLQQFFNNHMFKLEQEEYAREKITWTYIDFGVDSQQTIDLIEKKDSSIIALLDEETIFPRATDETLIQKLHTLAKKNPKYSEVQFKKIHFQIAHYAGDVLYDVKDWITKNKDPLQDDIAKALIASKRPFIASLFTDPDLDPRERLAQQKAQQLEAAGKKAAANAAASKGGASFLTVASAYKDQLADLMDTLRATEPNFIRCLIPNLQKKQQSLNAELILEQLACNGVLEGIRISRKGYPNRLVYPEFVRRYYLLHPSLKRDEPQSKDATEKIMAHLQRDLEKAFAEGDHPKPLWQFGLTKIFFRHGVLAKIEETRERKLGQMVIAIQAAARGWLGRSAFRKIGMQTNAGAIVQKNVKIWMKFRQWAWWQLFVKGKALFKKVGIEVVIKELEDKIAQLEKDIASAKSDRDKLRAEYQAKKEQLIRLREDVSSLNGRIGRLSSENDDLTKESASLQARLDDVERRLESTTKSRSATDTDLKNAEDELDKKSADLKKEEAQVKTLQALKDEHVASLKELADKQSKLEHSNATMRNAISTTQDELDQRSRELDSKESDGANQKKKLAGLQADLDSAKTEASSVGSECNKLKEAIRSAQANVADSQEDLTTTKNQVATIRGAIKELEREKSDLRSTLDRTERAVADLEKKKSKFSEELSSAQSSIAAEKSAVDASNKRNGTLAAEVAALQGDLSSLEKTRETLDTNTRSLGGNVSDLDAQLAGLRSQADKLKKQLAEVEASVAQKEAALDSLDAANQAAVKVNQKLDAQLKDAQDELDQLRDGASKRGKDNAVAEAKARSLQDASKDLSSAVAALTGENKTLAANVTSVQGQAADAAKAAAELDRRAKNTLHELADVRRDLEAVEDERARADKAMKLAQASQTDAQAEVAELERTKTQLDAKLKAKASEATELAGKAASDSIEKEKATWRAEKKKAQDDLDAARAKLDAAEAQRARHQRKIKKLQGEIADLKASTAQRATQAEKSRGGVNVEEETRRLEKERKTNADELSEDSANLKGLQSELEMLRDLIRRSITTAGEDKIRSIDGRAAKSSSSSSSSSSSASRESEPLTRGASFKNTDTGTLGRASAARFANLK